MQASIWIAIYLPMFVVLFVMIPSQQRAINIARKNRKIKGGLKMSNELIKNCVGKVCNISTGSLGRNFSKVKILEVVDNWIKVESKGKVDLINVDFVQNIKIIDK